MLKWQTLQRTRLGSGDKTRTGCGHFTRAPDNTTPPDGSPPAGLARYLAASRQPRLAPAPCGAPRRRGPDTSSAKEAGLLGARHGRETDLLLHARVLRGLDGALLVATAVVLVLGEVAAQERVERGIVLLQ